MLIKMHYFHILGDNLLIKLA